MLMNLKQDRIGLEFIKNNNVIGTKEMLLVEFVAFKNNLTVGNFEEVTDKYIDKQYNDGNNYVNIINCYKHSFDEENNCSYIEKFETICHPLDEEDFAHILPNYSTLIIKYGNKLKQIKDSYYDIDTDTTYLYFSEDEKHNTAEFTDRLDVTLYTLQDI